MTDARQISLDWERETGYDSIPTIERVYERTRKGAIKCIYPGCPFARFQAADMWRHVHGPAHRVDDSIKLPVIR